MRLLNKTAIVTGAASDFGGAITTTFVREGAKVVIADINAIGANAMAKTLGANALAVAGDVTLAPDVHRMVTAASALGQRIDIVVNNAGWTHRNKPMLEVTEDESFRRRRRKG
jgi:3-oxoacyl-[acyl-carrier protein] reductase